jgi:hypothetical protein
LTFDETGGVRTTPIISLTQEEFLRIRENLIATFVKDFQPAAMIVDFHPEGKNGELIPAIISSPETKKVLGLRGILGSPAETNREFFNSRLIAFIQDYFSVIHVYIDERVFRLEDYYSVPATLSAMFKYTGYVTRPTIASKVEARAILRLDSMPVSSSLVLRWARNRTNLAIDPAQPCKNSRSVRLCLLICRTIPRSRCVRAPAYTGVTTSELDMDKAAGPAACLDKSQRPLHRLRWL